MQRAFYFSNSLLNFFISSSSVVEIFSLFGSQQRLRQGRCVLRRRNVLGLPTRLERDVAEKQLLKQVSPLFMQRAFYFSNSLLNFFISSSSVVEIFSLLLYFD